MQGIDWNKIKIECSKSYELFLDHLRNSWKLNYNALPLLEDVCYCNIEKFFDNNGIIISISPGNTRIKDQFYKYKILYNNFNGYYNIEVYKKYDIKTRQEAKIEAIYKAFEILEDQL